MFPSVNNSVAPLQTYSNMTNSVKNTLTSIWSSIRGIFSSPVKIESNSLKWSTKISAPGNLKFNVESRFLTKNEVGYTRMRADGGVGCPDGYASFQRYIEGK